MRASDSDIRDLVFQCAIFQTSAATETYLRLVVESWAQKFKANKKGKLISPSTRAYFAQKQLDPHFAKYRMDGDEKNLAAALKQKDDLWPLMIGTDELPLFFSGSALHDKSSYPSSRNIRRLFARLGIDDMIGKLNANLGRDVEVLIEAFQSIRTALAHSSPPSITILDVEDRLADAKALV
jgi:hypothetical protein